MSLKRLVCLLPAVMLLETGSIASALQQPTAPAQTATKAALPSAAEVFERHRQAVGGEQAIRKIRTRRVKGRFEIPAQGMVGTLEILAAAPDKMRFNLTLGGLGEMLRGYDGVVGWSIDPAVGPRLLDGKELEELRYSADFYDDLHDLKSFQSVEVLERVSFEGRDCFKVKLVRPSGFEYIEYFDAATGLLAGAVTNSTSQMGTVQVTTIVGEYKQFGGILFPTSSRQKMMGLESVMTFTSVDYDPLPDDTFALPPQIAALAAAKAKP
jgi:hypothetical protein